MKASLWKVALNLFFGKASFGIFVVKNLFGWIICLSSASNLDEAINRSLPWIGLLILNFVWYGGAWLLTQKADIQYDEALCQPVC